MDQSASIKNTLRDCVAYALFFPALPFMRFAGPRRAHLHAVRGLLDRAGVAVVANHYAEPIYNSDHIFRDPAEPRPLAGIDWNIDVQKNLLEQFAFGDALRSLEGRIYRGRTFSYRNGFFGPGDAEALYCMIRHFKPRRLIEIGCGQSTLVARFAIEDAKARLGISAATSVLSRSKIAGWTTLASKSDANRSSGPISLFSNRCRQATLSSSIHPTRSGQWGTWSSSICIFYRISPKELLSMSTTSSRRGTIRKSG